MRKPWQSQAPLRNTDLYVSTSAEMTLGVAGGESRQLFVARIPSLLWHRLVLDGMIRPGNLRMGNRAGDEYVIDGRIVNYLLEYFGPSGQPPAPGGSR